MRHYVIEMASPCGPDFYVSSMGRNAVAVMREAAEKWGVTFLRRVWRMP